MSGPLHGRVAIVTGAARGIGKAITLELAGDGAAVVVAGRSETGSDEWPGSIHETVDLVRAGGGAAVAVRVDVNDDADCERLVAAALAEFGRLDLLVNNAALMGFGSPFLDGDIDYLDAVLRANVRAPYLLTLAAARAMRGCGGAIVNISSGATRHPIAVGKGGNPMTSERDRDPTVYSLSKAALDRMSTGMAYELHRDGIAVIALHPGFVLTERVTTNPREGMDLTRGVPMSQPARAVALLARDPMRYTGEIVVAADLLAEHGIAPS